MEWNTSSGQTICTVITGRCNVFLLKNNGLNLLIDTSTKSNRKKLQAQLQQLHIDHIDYVLLTHAHFDHIENAAFINQKYGAQVIIHKDESEILGSGHNYLPKGTIVFTRIIKHLGNLFSTSFVHDKCNAKILINDRLDLNQYGFNAYVIHTPGHSDGSCSLIVDNEIAIVGDAMVGVLPGKVFPAFADDIPTLVKSWSTLINSSCTTFLPAHGHARNIAVLQQEYQKYTLRYSC